MGRIADLVKRLDPHSLTRPELHELAALLDSLTNLTANEVRWGSPGGQIQEGPGIDITGSKRVGVGHDSVLLVDNTARVSAREYAVSSSGFSSALSSASSGDVILLPARSISGNHSITSGVKVVGYSRYATQLTGQITLASSSTIENLTITRTADDSTTYKGLLNPTSGTAYAHSCDIKVDQSGSGNAYAVSMDNNGIVEIWNCYTYGSSGSGNGYAVFDGGGTGSVVLFGGHAEGSTSEFG